MTEQDGVLPELMSLGNLISVLRGEMSRSELAKRAGIADTTISAIERDKVVPQQDTLMRIIAAFDLRPPNPAFSTLWRERGYRRREQRGRLRRPRRSTL